MRKKTNNTNGKDRIKEILSDDKQLTAILKKAVREAVQIHKRAGNPLATLKNGKAVWIKAE